MNTPTWHLAEARMSLDKFYDLANYQLSMVGKYEVKSIFLQEDKENLDNQCRQQVLKSKTLGLVFHDRWKLLLDDK